MIVLGYIDIRPFLFVGGLPLFVLLVLLVCWVARVRAHKGVVAALAALGFTVLFGVFLTGYGPFVGQTERREYRMTWEIRSASSSDRRQPEVVLSFVEYPGFSVGEYSAELAQHLRTNAADVVTVVFDVTYDYGKVRGFRAVAIDGLTRWRSGSDAGYAMVRGSPEHSPWE